MVDMRDMADVLRAAGVPVVEEGDWKHRGTGGSFDAEGLMLHHDASPPGSTSSSADYIIANLLSQLWLAFDGTWHVIAAGRMNHAGKGSWPGVPTDNANATFIGLETDHTANEQWTHGQRQYGLRGILALADWLGIRDSAEDLYRHLIAHKEWAPDRKVDPDPLDMDDLRELILHPPTEGAPVQTIQKSNTETRTLVNTEWRNLKFSTDQDDPSGMYAMAKGPASWFVLTAQVYASGPVGTRFQLRPCKEDGDEISYYQHRTFEIGADGKAAVEIAQAGSVAEGKYLRVQGWSAGGNVTINGTRGQIALW